MTYPGKEEDKVASSWLAGYMDAEACFERAGRAALSITNTHLPTLRSIQSEWGGSVRKRKLQPRCRQAWEWRIYGNSARAVCLAVYPFLHEKAKQCWLLLIAHTFPPRSARRESIEQELRDLKRVEYTE